MPKFNNLEDAVHFMNKQLGLMDARLLKLEGENIALRNAALTMWSVLADEKAKEHFKNHALGQIELFTTKHSTSDDNTKLLIDGLIDATRHIWIETDTDDGHPFTVIEGGKAD